ncbi:hypothetical protein [Agromyces larvae]|uniref:Uncharacterized protein n=1 Tax=Agromyces larvae TaxID=2929802 RepID=A0ABY4C4N4_9MICO|nr:hypothetical protein [Agromyces larvae]UOE45929.1 hypothetical protein MTO99_09370 [Agromyces larvae]
MTWHTLPATRDTPLTPSEIDYLERRLERWSQCNELGAWAFLEARGIRIEDPATGATLAILPADLDTFDDFAQGADRAVAA